MSYDINQYYGLGLKIKDIEEFIPKETWSSVIFPFEVINNPEVSKELLVKYGFFDQFASYRKSNPIDKGGSSKSLKSIKAELVKMTNPSDPVFYDMKKTLGQLVKAFKKDIEDHLLREQSESLLCCCLTCYLRFNVGWKEGASLDVLDDYTCLISSTRWGGVHNLGGMVPDEPYLIFKGWDSAQDGSWQDPRNDSQQKKILKSIEKYLVGKKHPGFKYLTPVFGG
jgi:hypothetical protein